MLPTAKIFGDIKTPELIIQNGVILEGRCVIANDLKASAKDVIEAEYLKDNLNENMLFPKNARTDKAEAK